MKFNIVLLFSILCLSKMLACSCVPIKLMSRASKADFIAKVSITDIQQDSLNNNYHNLNIEILELFKGDKISSVKLYSDLGSSCSMFTPKGTEWLIFADKNENDELTFGYCSGSRQIDRKLDEQKYPGSTKRYRNSLSLKMQMLTKARNILPKTDFYFNTLFSGECLKEFRNLEIEDNSFAFYELTINDESKIIAVNALIPFKSNLLKEELTKCIYSSARVSIFYPNNKNPMERKIVMGLFYGKRGTSDVSSIQQFNL